MTTPQSWRFWPSESTSVLTKMSIWPSGDSSFPLPIGANWARIWDRSEGWLPLSMRRIVGRPADSSQASLAPSARRRWTLAGRVLEGAEDQDLAPLQVARQKFFEAGQLAVGGCELCSVRSCSP